MKTIPVGSVHYAIVDDDDYDELSKFKWTVVVRNRTVHARRETRWNGMDGEAQYMHQMVTGYDQTDHINGLGLDNRRENLRSATHSQNKMNEPKKRGQYTSKFKGVSWYNRLSCWRAQVMLDRKVVYSRCFKSEEQAASAYDAAAREYFGEFANVNF